MSGVPDLDPGADYGPSGDDDELFFVRHSSSNVPVAAIVLMLFWLAPVVLYIINDYFSRARKRTVEEGEELPPSFTEQATVRADRITVLAASLEHSLPHLPKAKAVAGGLGKVMDLVARHHPTDIYMVHPMIQAGAQVDYGDASQQVEEEALRILVDGKRETIKVFRQTYWPGGSDGVRVEFLMLSHPQFEARTKESIYPNPMSRRTVLSFFSMWNQAVGALLARHKPDIFHCPDFHTAVAPWYALPQHPRLRVLLILHNAEYQGTVSTDMIRGELLTAMACIWNLPPDMVAKHLVQDGRFNMLKAGVDFIVEQQKGVGICAVSQYYAQECECMFSLFWRVPKIEGLDNPMLEAERAKLAKELGVTKGEAKKEIQEQFGLNVDPEARIFVSLGRLVRQKGVDLIADIAPWLLETFPSAQFVLIGPIGDGYGHYAAARLKALAEDERFRGRVFVRCEFMRVSDALKFAADFCLMPSRDEPFGYVDIEFAWRGALLVGAQAGGLGKVPGFYYVAQNRENPERMRLELKTVVAKAMDTPSDQLQRMAKSAISCDFHLDEWQRKLMGLYAKVLQTMVAAKESQDCETELAAIEVSVERGTFMPYNAPGASFSKSFMPEATVTPDKSAPPTDSLDMINNNMELQQSFLRDATPSSLPEFLTQELSEEEIAEKVQTKLQRGERSATIDKIIEEIGGDQDVARAQGDLSKWMLQETWGVKNVHLCVSIGYVAIPVCSFLTSVIAFEWGVRGSSEIPSWIRSMGWFQRTFGDSGIGVSLLHVLIYVVHALAMAIGAPVWTHLAKFVEPRLLLAASFFLQMPFLLAILPVSPSVAMSLSLVFVQGLVASSGLLFVVLNFMMSITGDLTQAAIRMGFIEMARHCASWVAMGYIFLVAPSSVQGTKEVLMPFTITLVLFPMALAVGCLIAASGYYIIAAPGPYRDDRSPGWDLRMLGKRKTFLFLSLSDCLGGLAAFPSTMYISWWLANGWESSELGVLLLVFGLVLSLGAYMWGHFLAHVLEKGYTPLIATAVLLGPPALVTALVQEEVSTFTFFGTSKIAMFICILTLLLEGIRSSAIWTVKMQVLNSRWRLLSFGTLFLSVQRVCMALSPLICELIARYYGASFLSTNQKELADAVVASLVPICIVQFAVQALALPFVQREFGLSVQSNRGYSTKLVMKLFRRSPLATSMFGVAILTLVISVVQWRHIHKPLAFTPTRRCADERPTKCKSLRRLTNKKSARPGEGFGKNKYGHYTTAKFNCMRMMLDNLEANTFVFSRDKAECELLQCTAQDVKLRRHMEEDKGAGFEVWSSFCEMSGQDLVMVHLFEWRFTDVMRECKEHLGPAGYDVVQISPVQEHIQGDKWYDRYQPVSHKLESRSGTRDEFIEMVKRCNEAGVQVMVDVVLNHMASTHLHTPQNLSKKVCGGKQETETMTTRPCLGFAGTSFGEREYHRSGEQEDDDDIDGFKPEEFHHFSGSLMTNCQAPPWTENRFVCDIFGLPDLDTEQPQVQKKLQMHLLELYEIGVTMLRIDAAVHIYPSSLAKMLEPFPLDYILQEVYPGPISVEMRTRENMFSIGCMTDFAYGSRLAARLFDFWSQADRAWTSNADRFQNFLSMSDRDEGCSDNFCHSPYPESKALLFLDNHDQQRFAWHPRQNSEAELKHPEVMCKWDGGNIGNCRAIYKHGQTYNLMTLYMLSFPYGDAVRIMSSYFWNDFDSGPPGVRVDSLTDRPTSMFEGTQPGQYPAGCRETPAESPLNATEDLNDERKWICEHRWQGVAALVRFRKVVRRKYGHTSRESVTNSGVCQDGGCIHFSLGEHAFVALHRGYNLLTKVGHNTSWNLTDVYSGLPRGAYCNLAMWKGPLDPNPQSSMGGCDSIVVIGADRKIEQGSVEPGTATVILVDYKAQYTGDQQLVV